MLYLKESLELIKKTIYKYLPAEEYKAFVYGSRADGTAEKWSDIDVGIKGEREVPGVILEEIREELENSDIPYKVEVVDFAKVSDKFRRFAMKEGDQTVTISEKRAEKAREVLKDLKSAAARLKEALELEETLITKDASIQRFEFTFELSWKLMQAVVKFKDIKTTGSVRDSIRTAAQLGLINDATPWLKFHDARNQATHTYDLDMADAVYQTIKEFPPFVHQLIQSAERTLAEG